MLADTPWCKSKLALFTRREVDFPWIKNDKQKLFGIKTGFKMVENIFRQIGT